MKKFKKPVALLLSVLMMIGFMTAAPLTVYAQEVGSASTGAVTLYWPVYGHTSLSRGVGNGHNGIDITDASINGATVRAAIGGTVTSIWLCPENHYYSSDPMPSCCSGNGHGLVIRGDDGRYYNYAHMQAGSIPTDSVHYGARVNAGQTIGKVGSTGNSSGPHLHFQISTSSSWWLYGIVNPQNETYNYNPTSTSENPQQPSEQIIDYGDDFYGLLYHKPSFKPIGQSDVYGNVEMMDETRTNIDHLLWHFTKNSDGKSYRIQSLYNGKYLYTSDGFNGANVSCQNYSDSDNQKWYFIRKNGVDAMKPVGSSSVERVLDLPNGNTATGTNVQLWEWNGTASQNFAPYYVTNADLNLNYTITADKTELLPNDYYTTITIGGKLPYVYNYKFHIIDPEGNEIVVDRGCKPTYEFFPNTQGTYIIYAEVKNTHYTEIGSKTNKFITITMNPYPSKEDFEYRDYDDSVIITGYKGSSTEVVIPPEIDGKPVTVIGYQAFQNNKDIISIIIPDSVTLIDMDAFSGCTALTSVTIPDSVTSIGGDAFWNCTGLKSITIPNSVTYIGSMAFCNCKALTSIIIPNGVTRIEVGTFSGCTGLTSITIPDSVTYIKEYAFYQCTGLTSIMIPDSVTQISYSVFEGCENLTIYGYKGSYSETYANKNNIPFVALGDTGDVSGNGIINIDDATEIQKYIAELIEFTDGQKFVADTDGDGIISIKDVTQIQRYAAEYIDKLG